jgi:hypothetical protein
MNTTARTTGRSRNHRARWAAIGAAVAVSLGAGGLGIARAASPDAATYSPTSPCRLLDTRPDPAFHIGNHSTLGPESSVVVDGQGAQGDCNLPSDSTALQLNVTAVGASAPTYLTLFPGTGNPPNASHLNPTPGQPPTPNAVTVALDDGRFSIFNKYGTVDVIVDVVGAFARPDAANAEQVLTIPANAFRPGTSTLAYWSSPYDGAYTNVDNGSLDAPVLLPEGALITKIKYHVRDTHASVNLTMQLRGALQPSGSDMGAAVSSMNSSGTPGNVTLTHDLSVMPHVVHDDTSYFVRVTSPGWGTAAGDLRIKGVEISYILPGGYRS